MELKTEVYEPEITVYSKENCVQCRATYRALGKAGLREGLDYAIKMLEDNPEDLNRLREAGHLQAPVVETPEDTWSGFRPDKIKQIKQVT